jgi:holo-[acyl-carrier protein] synthase
MIVGIGTDIVEIARIEVSVQRWGEKFATKILSANELSAYRQRGDVAYLAKRFAAKEAVSKALGTGMRCGVGFTQIEVVGERGYPPRIVLNGAAANHAERLGVRVSHLSLSDERQYAIAYVILES